MRQSQEAGFLLLELVVAMGIFAVGITAMGGLLMHLVIGQRALGGRMDLVFALQQHVEMASPPSKGISEKIYTETLSGRTFVIVECRAVSSGKPLSCFFVRDVL
jgi:hypothetical protein